MQYNIQYHKTIDAEQPWQSFMEIIGQIQNAQYPHPNLVITGEIWFRGEPRVYDSKLIPNLFRTENNQFEEADLLRRFQQRFPAYGKDCNGTLDWLNIMQHYGIPTRMLDWSKNALVALYFSVTDDSDENGALYAYQITDRFCREPLQGDSIVISAERNYNFYEAIVLATTSTDIIKILKDNIDPRFKPIIKEEAGKIFVYYKRPGGKIVKYIDLPAVSEYFPKMIHDRILLQQGSFSLHFGKFINGRNIISDELTYDYNGFINSVVQVTIPKCIKKQLRRELNFLGITPLSLFPEPENFYESYKREKSLL